MLAALPLALLFGAPALLRSCVGPAPATRRHSATLSNPARHRCDVIYCSTACLSADRARRDCDETLHPHAFWCARAWFMMCCAWCSRAWGCAAACTSRAASQKPMRGCPSAAKRRRRRRRKSRMGSMAAAAPRRCKWAATRPRYRSAELEISKNGTGFLRRGPETRPGGVARPLLPSRKVPKPGRRGTHLSKASPRRPAHRL